MKNPFPASVRKIGIPAPAGVPDCSSLELSLDLIRQWNIEPVCGSYLFDTDEAPFYAADCARRAEDFNRMLNDSSIDLILCARGGYGSAQILPLIDWKTLRRRRLPVLGYSDITALHLGMLARKAGLPVEAQMAASLHRSLHSRVTRVSFAAALRGDLQKVPLNPVIAGDAAGPLVAANLSLLASLCGTPYLPDFRGTILLLEDVGEKPRVLDRHLTQLLLSGILAAPAAIVFGDFTRCGDSALIDSILERFAVRRGGTVYRGLPFGHSLPSMSFRLGVPAVISGHVLSC